MPATNPDQTAPTLSCELLRPSTHFMPPANWMNDPNGLIHWKGEYHVFYQHNPFAPSWATMHWGHAVTEDLLTWRHLPIALAPDSPVDAAGCFSGCCIDHGGVPTIVYTGVSEGPDGTVEQVVTATSTDDLLTWTKQPTPILAEPGGPEKRSGFRDPFVWQTPDGGWNLIIGSGTPERGGEILIYHSHDFDDWEYRGVLLDVAALGSDAAAAEMWEFPQFISLPDADLLVFTGLDGRPETHNTVQHGPTLVAGRLSGDHFAVEASRKLDHGWSFRAPAAFKASGGAAIVMGWLREGSVDEVPEQCGWAGVMSYPRSVSYSGLTGLSVRPAAALDRLRKARVAAATGSGDASIALSFPALPAFEVSIQGSPRDTGTLRFELADGEHQKPAISIVVDLAEAVLGTCVRSSDGLAMRPHDAASARADAMQEGLDLRLFVDGSVVELFVNGCISITERLYLSGDKALTTLRVSGQPDIAGITEIVVWELASQGGGA